MNDRVVRFRQIVRNIAEHNARINQLVRGVEAQEGTAETDADPRNPVIWNPPGTADANGVPKATE
jgi:hypothetical protein